MTYNFTLPCKAFSVNAYHYRRNFAKTAEAKEYEAQILALLEEHKILYELADEFKESGGVFKFHINCEYPKHILVNENKQLSSKAFDVDNVIKPLIDLVLTQFMGISDRFVVECSSKKSIGPAHAIQISLELLSQEF